MAPLQGAGASQPIPPEEGTSSSQAPPDASQPDDPGPSSFLENLDMSQFQPFDFDFSSLMDSSLYTAMTDVFDTTDQTIPLDAAMTGTLNTADQMIPMVDQASFDFNNIHLPAPIDPSLLQLSGEDWLRQLPELNNLAPLSFESMNSTLGNSFFSPPPPSQAHQTQRETLQGHDPCPQYHQAQAPSGISRGALSWGPVASQIGSTDHIMPSETTTMPSTLAEQQRTDEHTNDPSTASSPNQMNTLPLASGPVIRYQGPLPPARRGGRTGRLTEEQAQQQQIARLNGDFPLSQAADFPRGPSGRDIFEWVSHFASICCMGKIKCEAEPLGRLVNTNYMVPFVFWVSEWLCHRHAELSLFRFLQSATSHARDNSKDQKEFIYSVLFILSLSHSGKSDAIPRPKARSDLSEAEFTDFLDRQHRVRTALWIYASVFIGKLDSWTNFWEHLPKPLEVFRRNTPNSLRNSLEGFDLDLNVSLYTYSKKKIDFLRHDFPFSGEYNPDNAPKRSRCPSKDLHWTQLRKITYQRMPENDDAVYNGPGSPDTAVEYFDRECRKMLAPESHAERDAAAQYFFGALISMANSPTIRSDSPFSSSRGISPSRAFVEFSLLEFQHRIPGLCPYQCPSEVSTTGRDKTEGPIPTTSEGLPFIHEQTKPEGTRDPAYCLKTSGRFLELANLLGEAAFFMGPNADTPRPLSMAGWWGVMGRGNDGDFHYLKRLLSSNSSWLKTSCTKLNGLFQALLQISERGNEVERVRTFQRLLRRKVRDAFGHRVLEASRPSPESRHMALLLSRMFSKYLSSYSECAGLSKQQKAAHTLLRFSVAKVAEQVFEGRSTAPDELALPQQFGQILAEVQNEFMVRYFGYMSLGSANEFDTKMDIMEQRISKVMASLNNWFPQLHYGTPDDGSVEAELRKAFGDLFAD
ncbi:hypothetical protein ACJZ2D_008291 [Fusarium nematophilum]